MTRISVNPFNLDSIQNAISQVEGYAEKLNIKTGECLEAVTQDVFRGVSMGFNGAPYNEIITDNRGFSFPAVPVSVEKADNHNKVVASGKDAVFIEFGAGVHYNANDIYPNRPSWIEKIGEYGHGYGKQDIWAYYDKSVGKWVQTHGTPASMPMYNSANFTKLKISEIVRRIFNNPG